MWHTWTKVSMGSLSACAHQTHGKLTVTLFTTSTRCMCLKPRLAWPPCTRLCHASNPLTQQCFKLQTNLNKQSTQVKQAKQIIIVSCWCSEYPAYYHAVNDWRGRALHKTEQIWATCIIDIPELAIGAVDSPSTTMGSSVKSCPANWATKSNSSGVSVRSLAYACRLTQTLCCASTNNICSVKVFERLQPHTESPVHALWWLPWHETEGWHNFCGALSWCWVLCVPESSHNPHSVVHVCDASLEWMSWLLLLFDHVTC